MPNRYNYATNIANLNGRYTKYMVSRVIDNPQNKLLEIEAPTEIPENFVLEILFYSLTENYLLSSVFLTSEDTEVVKVTTLRYADTSIRRLLFIDFSKISINIEEGRLQTVINFFVPEIGGFDESKFSLTRISPSRKEVELSLIPQCITEDILKELKIFTSPQINSEWVFDAIKQIFNQPASSTSNNIPTDKTNLTFGIIKEYLPSSSKEFLNNTASIELNNTIEQNVQRFMNIAYGYASQSIVQTNSGSMVRYTNDMLIGIISASIDSASKYYTQNSEFTLV